MEKMDNNITEKQQRPHHPKSFVFLDDEETMVVLTFQGEDPDLKVLEEELNKAGFYPKSIKSQKNK